MTFTTATTTEMGKRVKLAASVDADKIVGPMKEREKKKKWQ